MSIFKNITKLGILKNVRATNTFYVFPEYADAYYQKGLIYGDSIGLDDNFFDFIEFGLGFDCGTSYNWITLSGYSSACASMNIYQQSSGGQYFSFSYPTPNSICCLRFSCSSQSGNTCFSSFAYVSLSGGATYTAFATSQILLYVDQQKSLNADSLVQFASAFTLQSARMQQKGSSVIVSTSISGQNIQFSFSASQSSTSYFFYIGTTSGKHAYSNEIPIQVVDCTPSFSLAGFTNPASPMYAMSVPYSVFLASTYTTNNNPTYCALSYQFYDASNNVLPGTSPLMSCDSTTGEFKINQFGSFSKFVKVQVTGTYTSNSVYKGTVSSSTTVTINIVQPCVPTISTIPNFIFIGLIVNTPYSVFLPSAYVTNSMSALCTQSYTFYDQNGNQLPGASTASINSGTGEFQILSFGTDPIYGSGCFKQSQIKFTVKGTLMSDTSLFTSAQSNSFDILFSNTKDIKCALTINPISDILQAIYSLTTPLSVLSTIPYAHESMFPTYCVLQYRLFDSSGTEITSLNSPTSFDSSTGQIYVTSFSNNIFSQSFYIIIKSTYINSTATVQSNTFSVKYFLCPSVSTIGNFAQQVYNLNLITVFTTSIYSSQTISPNCILNYKLYDSNGNPQSSPQMSLDQNTGEFKILSYTNYLFSQTIKIQVTYIYLGQTLNSVFTNSIQIDFFQCFVTINSLSNFNKSISNFTLPYKVFSGSQYIQTANPSLCTLTQSVIFPNGSDIAISDYMSFDSQSQFWITKYNAGSLKQFTQDIIVIAKSVSLLPGSVFQKVNQTISINVFSCQPFINQSAISNFHKFSINCLVSQVNFDLLKIEQLDKITDTPYNNQNCILSYDLYFQNGTLCSKKDVPITLISEGFIITLITEKKAFNHAYYFTVTSTSQDKSYKNSLNSSIITVQGNVNQVCSQTSLYTSYKIINKMVNNLGFSSNLSTSYYEGSDCDIKNTVIINNGFNPNMVFILDENQNSLFYQFPNFTTNNVNCTVYIHNLQGVGSDFDVDLIFKNGVNIIIVDGNKQQIMIDVSRIQFDFLYKYKLKVIARPLDLKKEDQKIRTQEYILNAQIKVVHNCNQDQIYQNMKLPKAGSPMLKQYKILNGLPILYLNISQKIELEVDVRERIMNNYPVSCPLKYQIGQVVQNDKFLDQQYIDQVLEMSSKGIIQFKKQSKIQAQNLQIHFSASNPSNVNFTSSNYIIDFSNYAEETKSFKFTKSQKIRKSKSQACSGFISSISQGQVKIIFNDIMRTNFSHSLLNESNIQMYINPAKNRQLDEDFDPSTLNFTWTVNSFIKETMIVLLNFSYPLEVSPLVIQDQLVINFNGSKNLLFCTFKKTFLDEDYSILLHNVPPQVPQNQLSLLSGVATSGQIFSNGPIWLLISGAVVVVIGIGSMMHYQIYVRTLQFILLMPAIPIVLQANLVSYLKVIKSVADYDVLSYIDVWNLPLLNKLTVDNNPPLNIINQMQDIGHDNRNAMVALGTFTFAIFFYFIQIVFLILIGFYILVSMKKLQGQHFFEKLRNKVFFNNILAMAIEGMIEFLINGYLNAMTAQISSLGEIIGISLSAYCIFASAVLLPAFIISICAFKTQEQIRNESFQEKFGVLFQGLKIKTTYQRIYFLMYWSRRIIIISMCLLMKEQMGSITLLTILTMNFIYGMYIGSNKPLENRYQNYQEMINEVFVQACYLMLIIQSDWVQSKVQKFKHGFYLTYTVIIYSLINIIIILYDNFKSVSIVLVKFANLICFYKEKFVIDRNEKVSLQKDDQSNKGIKQFNQLEEIEKQQQKQIQYQDVIEKIFQYQNLKQKEIQSSELNVLKKKNQKLKFIPLESRLQNVKMKNFQISIQLRPCLKDQLVKMMPKQSLNIKFRKKILKKSKNMIKHIANFKIFITGMNIYSKQKRIRFKIENYKILIL